MNKHVKRWLRGIAAAVINSVANSMTVMIVDPFKFNIDTQGGWASLGKLAIMSSIVGASLYLKDHSLPPDDDDDYYLDPRRLPLILLLALLPGFVAALL